MDLKEAMQKRHMVRKYIDKSLPDDLINRINERISMNNEKHKLSMKLMINNNKGVNSIMKLIMAKGVNNFIILAGDNSENLDERLGYSGADIMLYAQTLGLNTWWVGGTFNRSVSQYVENKKVTGIIAIGYGESQGKPHKSTWFISGVDGALLAPTALNKQDFMIIGDGNKVKIECDNGIFTGSNVGLIKYHFELGAGKENFEWE